MPQIPNNKKDSEIQKLSPEEKRKFSNMVKFLSRAFVQTQTFGMEHPLSKQPIEQCFTLLSTLIQEKSSIALYIAEKKLRYGQAILEEKNPVVDRLILLFTSVQLVSLKFEKEFSREDFLKLLSIFAVAPKDIIAAGGIEKLVKEKGVGHLQLNPIKYELIGMDEKIVSEEAILAEETLKALEKQLLEKQTAPKLQEKEEETKKSELLSLIDKSLKEETEQSLFVEKLTENPLEIVNLIIEAIRMVNRVGGENAKMILSSIVNKIALIGEDIYRCLSEGKEDTSAKQTYRAAGILGKELTKQIKDIQVAPDLNNIVKEMTNILTVVLDQIEAQKIFTIFFKKEPTLKSKVKLLKKIMQREKSSPEFGLMMKKLLVLKGMTEEEVKDLIDKKEVVLEEAKEEKESIFTQDLTSMLQKIKDGQIGIEDAVAKLKEVLRKNSAKL